jgi:hypothetical protein
LAIGLSESASVAMLPGILIHSTVQAALRFAAGETAAAGIVSAPVSSLVKGGLEAMAVSKLKVTGVLLVASIVVTGAGVLTHQALAIKQPDGKQASAVQTLRIAEAPTPKRAADEVPPPDEPDKSGSFVCGGRVLDPEGKPLAGAAIYLIPPGVVESDSPVRARTGADGSFRFVGSRPKQRDPALHPPLGEFTVVASVAGYGPDWASKEDSAALGNLTLRLVKDDVPIEGRLFTQEGKPIAGAKVSVRSLRALPGTDLTPYIQAMRDGKFFASNHDFPGGPGKMLQSDLPWQPPRGIPGLPQAVHTDAQGRFRLTGLGRERVVELNIEGTAIHSSYLTAMTRGIPPVVAPSLSAVGAPSVTVYGATLEHLVPPGRTIQGIVRDKHTNQPLAGIWISGRGINARVRTDAQGRYELSGCPKDKEYAVFATPDLGGLYFVSSRTVPDQAGLGPIQVDLQLVRGIPFRGKVTDQATGKPVRAVVSYFPIYPNANASAVPGYGAGGAIGAYSSDTTGNDGSFTCVVLPGPGAVTVRADGNKYRPACVDPVAFFHGDPNATLYAYGNREVLSVTVKGNQGMTGMYQEQYQAIVLINPAKVRTDNAS